MICSIKTTEQTESHFKLIFSSISILDNIFIYYHSSAMSSFLDLILPPPNVSALLATEEGDGEGAGKGKGRDEFPVISPVGTLFQTCVG